VVPCTFNRRSSLKDDRTRAAEVRTHGSFAHILDLQTKHVDRFSTRTREGSRPDCSRSRHEGRRVKPGCAAVGRRYTGLTPLCGKVATTFAEASATARNDQTGFFCCLSPNRLSTERNDLRLFASRIDHEEDSQDASNRCWLAVVATIVNGEGDS